MIKKPKLTYQKSGVNYAKIDPLKVLAQEMAKKTSKNINLAGFKELPESRGESAYVVDCGDFYLASITECLGTKALVADEMYRITGKTYYDQIAQDTIAMAVNDIITVGARPISIHAYWATGNSDWFNDKQRMKDLVNGWKKACDLSGVSWGGGETPALNGVINPNTIDLAASCVGIIKPKNRLILGKKLQVGDAIIFLESSGIHANGLSLARKLAKQLSSGYATKIGNNLDYGEALLKPTIIYAKLIEALFIARVDLHYISNITGHGWLKLMRYPKSFTYRINQLPPVPLVLKFIVKQCKLSPQEAYSTFNMGVGIAIFIPEKDVRKTLLISKKVGIKAFIAGRVEVGKRQVIIEPLNIVYKGEDFILRA